MKAILGYSNSLLSVCMALISVTTYAEDLTDLSLEELVNVEIVSASRIGQQANKAPASVAIITADDIRKFGWRTLAEALNSLRSLNTFGDRNYTFLGVRGFSRLADYNSRTLVMIDGLRMNENVYDSGNIGHEFMLDLDLVERIEFIPGSGSTIYGANAFLGMINVVTKQGQALNGSQLAGEAGTFDSYKGRLSYGKRFDNGVDWLVSASHFDSAGVGNLYFPAHDRPDTNNGIAHYRDGESSTRFFTKANWNDLTLSAGLVQRYRNVPTAPWGEIFNDPAAYDDDKQFFVTANYQHDVSDKTTIRASAFYQGYDFQAEDAYDYGGRIINRDITTGRWLGSQIQLTSRMFEHHRLMTGLEYQYDLEQHLCNYDIQPYSVWADDRLSGHRVEWYVQDDIELHDDFTASLGMRIDYLHLLKDVQVNPRVGLIYSPSDALSLKLLYSSTFRAPNSAELTYNRYYPGQLPTLNAEEIRNYEAVAEWRPESSLKLLAALHSNHIDDLLETNQDGLLVNHGHYHTYGLELEAEKRWQNGRLFKASYAFNYLADEHLKEARGYGSPLFMVKLHYAEPVFYHRATFSIENIFISSQKTFSGQSTDAYNLLNLHLTTEPLLNGWTLSLDAYNLLDTAYEVPGTGVNDILTMNGRELRIKLMFSF